MQLLKERILRDGRFLPGGVLKVDGFVNHQIDARLMYDVAEEFRRRFEGTGYNKILTVEASGIAPAVMLGYLTGLPVLFAKKQTPKTMEGMVSAPVHSFTKDKDYHVCVSRSFLGEGDRVLFIDDFLAYGSAAAGMMDLARQAGAEIAGMGFVIEKSFQGGSALLRERGVRVESLAVIESISDGEVVFG